MKTGVAIQTSNYDWDNVQHYRRVVLTVVFIYIALINCKEVLTEFKSIEGIKNFGITCSGLLGFGALFTCCGLYRILGCSGDKEQRRLFYASQIRKDNDDHVLIRCGNTL